MTIKKLPISLTDDIKKRLEKMAEETGIPMSSLIRMATLSMLSNYEMKGSFIFADLLNPDHKK